MFAGLNIRTTSIVVSLSAVRPPQSIAFAARPFGLAGQIPAAYMD